MSGNEADRNQNAMTEVRVKTATEKTKPLAPAAESEPFVSLAPVYEAA
jgi:hypothetical protein